MYIALVLPLYLPNLSFKGKGSYVPGAFSWHARPLESYMHLTISTFLWLSTLDPFLQLLNCQRWKLLIIWRDILSSWYFRLRRVSSCLKSDPMRTHLCVLRCSYAFTKWFRHFKEHTYWWLMWIFKNIFFQKNILLSSNLLLTYTKMLT